MSQGGMFRVRCQDCGPVEAPATAVRLAVPTSAARAFYTFRCPGCQRANRRPADPELVALLRAGGVTSVQIHSPG